jgi:hypothetical protein
VIQEALRQTELIGKQIYAQSSLVLSRAGAGEPSEILRKDRDLRSLLDASVGYAPHLVDAMITDRAGKAILHSEDEKEGAGAPERPSLQGRLSVDPVRRFRALYRGAGLRGHAAHRAQRPARKHQARGRAEPVAEGAERSLKSSLASQALPFLSPGSSRWSWSR